MAPLANRKNIRTAHAAAESASTYRQAAWEHGFRPLPVKTREKKPFGVAWREVALGDFPPCAAPGAVALPAALSTGILCDGLRVIDVDVDDPDLAELVARHAFNILGDALIRFRADSSRILLVYAAAEGEPAKRSIHGARGGVEVLGKGQQFVADGTHPGGQPYQWRFGCPADTRRENLVAVTEDSITSFLDVVRSLLRTPDQEAEFQRVEEAPQVEVPRSAICRPDLASHPLVRAWALGALRSAVDAVTACADGGRNNKLNDSALGLGELVGGGWLLEVEVRAALEEACHRNGYTSSDGIHAVRATISSGLTAGMKRPRAIPESILAKLDAQMGNWQGRNPEEPDIEEGVASDKVVDFRALTSRAPKEVARPFIFYGETEADPPRMLIKNTLPRDGVALLGGQSGAGKTFIVCNLAVALATGANFFGRRVKEQVAVAILAAEGAATLPMRLKVAGENEASSPNLPIAHKAISTDLMKAGNVANLIQELRELNEEMMVRFRIRLGAVFLDTVATSFGFKDENSNAEVTLATNALHKIALAIDALVIGVHHYGKDPSTGLRGGSAWRGNVDNVLVVMGDRDHKTAIVKGRSLLLEKNRVGPEGPIALFSLSFVRTGSDEDGEDVGDCIVVPDLVTELVVVSGSDAVPRTGSAAVAFRQAFLEALAGSGEERLIFGSGPRARVVDISHVRTAFARFYTPGKTDEKSRPPAVNSAWHRELRASSKSGFLTGFWDEKEWIWSKR
jgi:hypothetical protein